MTTTESIWVNLIDGALGPSPIRPDGDACGAWVVFDGVVRRQEQDRPLEALRYTAYEPMAQNVLRDLAESVRETHGLLCVIVEHSRGVVPVGACSFRLCIGAAHRKEALAAMDEFIDRMKQDVPIWKEPVWAAT